MKNTKLNLDKLDKVQLIDRLKLKVVKGGNANNCPPPFDPNGGGG